MAAQFGNDLLAALKNEFWLSLLQNGGCLFGSRLQRRRAVNVAGESGGAVAFGVDEDVVFIPHLEFGRLVVGEDADGEGGEGEVGVEEGGCGGAWQPHWCEDQARIYHVVFIFIIVVSYKSAYSPKLPIC
jgi:hypothetical protein